MDIRSILQNDADRLLVEEIDMLEEELAVGDYDKSYLVECRSLIEQERHARKVAHQVARAAAAEHEGAQHSGKREPTPLTPHVSTPTKVGVAGVLSPFNEVQEVTKSPKEIVSADVSVMRRSQKRKSLFREYLKNQQLVDEAFLDANLALFDEWERSAILDSRRLSEAFLEKYFTSLDPSKIATKQQFSEEFFMRHFSDMDARLVLQKGKNAWRLKENRSKRLDTFLRLKGVRF